MLAQPSGGELLINPDQRWGWSRRPWRVSQSGVQRREAALAEVEGAARVSREAVWQVAAELGPWRVVVRLHGPTCP